MICSDDAVEDRDDETEPRRDAHVVAGAEREVAERGDGVGEALTQRGQAAAGGVGVEGHEQQHGEQEEQVGEHAERAGEQRHHEVDELPGVGRLRDRIDLVLLDPEAAQRGAGVHDGVVHLVGVRREQVGQPSHGHDEGEGEQHQHQVGDQQHEARDGPPREPGPLEPPADRVQRDREDHGQEDRPDDVADGPRPGQRDREGGHPDQQRRGEGTCPVDDPWCRTWRVGHLGLPWQQEQACSMRTAAQARANHPHRVKIRARQRPDRLTLRLTRHRVMSRPWVASAQMTKTSSVMIVRDQNG